MILIAKLSCLSNAFVLFLVVRIINKTFIVLVLVQSEEGFCTSSMSMVRNELALLDACFTNTLLHWVQVLHRISDVVKIDDIAIWSWMSNLDAYSTTWGLWIVDDVLYDLRRRNARPCQGETHRTEVQCLDRFFEDSHEDELHVELVQILQTKIL